MEKQLSARQRAKLEADEIWDLYDENRMPTGRTHRRGDPMKPGEYHLDIHGAIFNSQNQLLIQQRQPFKRGWPNIWDLTVGGSAKAGETSRMAAEREVCEELGLKLDLTGIRPQMTLHFDEGFDDYYFIQKEIDIQELKLQEEEVRQVKWVTKEEALQMQEEGILAPYLLLDAMFTMSRQFDCRVFPEEEIVVRKATENQLASWMNLVEIVQWNFPGLETEEALGTYRETVIRNMKRGTAICALSGKRVVGMLLYSPKRNQLSFMAVHPNFRRRGIGRAMVKQMLEELDRTRDIVVETFREGDEKAAAPRAFYRSMGFEEGELCMAEGHPGQMLVLRGSFGGGNIDGAHITGRRR